MVLRAARLRAESGQPGADTHAARALAVSFFPCFDRDRSSNVRLASIRWSRGPLNSWRRRPAGASMPSRRRAPAGTVSWRRAWSNWSESCSALQSPSSIPCAQHTSSRFHRPAIHHGSERRVETTAHSSSRGPRAHTAAAHDRIYCPAHWRPRKSDAPRQVPVRGVIAVARGSTCAMQRSTESIKSLRVPTSVSLRPASTTRRRCISRRSPCCLSTSAATAQRAAAGGTREAHGPDWTAAARTTEGWPPHSERASDRDAMRGGEARRRRRRGAADGWQQAHAHAADWGTGGAAAGGNQRGGSGHLSFRRPSLSV